MAKPGKAAPSPKKVLSDEIRLNIFKSAVAMGVGNLQRQSALSKRGVPDWRVITLFRSLIDLGVELDVLETPGGSDSLESLKQMLG